MKFGVHFGALGDNVDLADGFQHLAGCGIDGVELVMRERSALDPKTPAGKLREIRRMAGDHGLAVFSLSNACLWSFPLTSSDAAVRRRGKESLLRQIDMATELGAGNLLVIPGYAGTDYVPSGEKVRYDVAAQRARDGIAAALPRAQAAGVCLCVENVWNRLFLSPLELCSLVDGFDSPSLGLYFDVGNAMLYGDPELWIEVLGQRIRAVHIKDVLRNRADETAHVRLGEGDVPFFAVKAALKRIGYEGYCTLELHRSRGFDSAKEQLAVMRRLFSGEAREDVQ